MLNLKEGLPGQYTALVSSACVKSTNLRCPAIVETARVSRKKSWAMFRLVSSGTSLVVWRKHGESRNMGKIRVIYIYIHTQKSEKQGDRKGKKLDRVCGLVSFLFGKQCA